MVGIATKLLLHGPGQLVAYPRVMQVLVGSFARLDVCATPGSARWPHRRINTVLVARPSGIEICKETEHEALRS